MVDPVTTNIGAYVPSLGSDVGSWNQPVNANTSTMDSLAANVAIIGLTNAPVTLTVPPNSGAAWSGPYQSQSGILRFTGVLSSAVTVTIPRAGFFICENLCTVGSFYVALASSAPGNVVCAPPGEATHVYCDGVNVKYVDFGRIGSYMDLAVSAVPAWITNCTVPPYLNCNGAAFSAVTYPALAAYLGGTTLPDSKGRSRFALDQGAGRITTAGSGFDGTTLLAGGGDQLLQTHNHTASSSVTDPGHTHVEQGSGAGGPSTAPLAGNYAIVGLVATTQSSTTGITVATTVANAGGGAAQNVPPAFVGGLTLIRAG